MPPTAADTYFPLATETATGYHGPELSGEDAGAAGDSSTGVELSHGGLIAIIIVVVVVAILGIGTSILYYMAKKREWQLRERMRRSARRVMAALTPRSRTEFPRDVMDTSRRSGILSRKGANARLRLDDVPPTPKLRPEDLEKHLLSARGGIMGTSTTATSKMSSEGEKKENKRNKGVGFLGKKWPGN